jgi:hypothetical protein
MSITNSTVDLTASTADLEGLLKSYLDSLEAVTEDDTAEWLESGIEIIDHELSKRMVLAYIKINWFQPETVIAHALDLPVLAVLDILLELERTDPDVVTRDSIIGYIGHTDRIN